MKAEVCAVIPARGGSKGIPRKNLALLGGRPLVAHTIEAALGCPLINRVIVSTDDAGIAEAAKDAGAEVPFLRPNDLAGDQALVQDAVRHTLIRLRDEEGYRPTHYAVMYPTSPFRTQSVIRKVLDAVMDGFMTAVTVRGEWVTPHTFVDSTAGFVRPLRGNVPEAWVYASAGSVKAVSTGWLDKDYLPPKATQDRWLEWCKEPKSRRVRKLVELEHPSEAVDIDMPEDLRRAEGLLGAESFRRSAEEVARNWAVLLERLRGVPGFAVVAVTDAEETLKALKAAGVEAVRVAPEEPRSEGGWIRRAARLARQHVSGNVLVCNVHYPSLRAETLSNAVSQETPAVSVRRMKLPVHRFFTFRDAGAAMHLLDGAVPEGDVMVEYQLGEDWRPVRHRVRPASEAGRPRGSWARIWGSLCPARDSDMDFHFEIEGKWRFDLERAQWVNTENGKDRVIYGRGDFPTVSRLADAFAFGPVETLASLEGPLSKGEVRSVELEETEIDVLRANVAAAAG